MESIYFQKAAEIWNDAFPVGNGFVGAMVFGGTGRERIQVNEDSLWSGGYTDRLNPDASGNLNKVRELLFEGKIFEAERLAGRSMFGTIPHMSRYQPMGDIWIDFLDTGSVKKLRYDESGLPRIEEQAVKAQSYYRRLDLENAVGTIGYCYGEKKYLREFFISNPAKTGFYHMKAEGKALLNFEVSVTRKDNRAGRGASFCDEILAEESRYIRMSKKPGAEGGIGFTMEVGVFSLGGSRYQIGSHIIVEGAKEALICFTGRTTFRSNDTAAWCRDCLKDVTIEDYERFKKAHVKDYHRYFDRHRLYLEAKEDYSHIPTPERMANLRNGGTDIGLLNLYYNLGRYLLISSSREGSLPANLQGIWNEEFAPMWGSKYTININIQMNYWLAEKTGLPELHMPLFEHLKRMLPHGQETAEKMYHARGFCCHHNTDLWGDCAPQDNHTTATIWPMGGAWLCLHIYEHYLYTGDKKFLKEYYPILRESVLFFLDYMVKDAEGNWVTGPSCSPENVYINDRGEYGSLCMGPAMDTEIVRELFHAFLGAAKELGEKKELVDHVKERLEHLPALKVGKHGQIQEWLSDYEEMEPGHRHVSQLFALYPAQQIRMDTTPKLAKAAAVTLKRRLENGGGHTGWSKAWIVLLYARLWNKEEAYKNLVELLANATLDNLLDNHPPFQIDGNFGGACGILEMIIQDYGDRIYLLPALPKQMKDGYVEGVRTKSGHILNMSWRDGEVKKLEIFGETGTELVIVRNGHASENIRCPVSERKKLQYD